MRESSVDTIISTISMKHSASSAGGKKRRSVTGSIIWLYIDRKFWNFLFAAPSPPSSSTCSRIVSRICAW